MVGQIAKAADGFADHAECRAIAVDAVLSISRDLGNHQPGPHGLELVALKPHLRELSGSEILDKRVAGPNQVENELHGAWLLQIHGDAAFVARMHRPPRRARALDLSTPLTDGIAGERFHLDHVGSKICEKPSAKRRGDKVTEFDDAQSG
jgi:hypothetical protein